MQFRSLVVATSLAVSTAALAEPPDGGLAPTAAPAPTPWSLFRTPAPGPARAIGGYSAGCIEGAAELPLRGPGFLVARPERHRVFGHPLLVAMVRTLAESLTKLHLGTLSVGDLAQPRGGPAPSGHASHQSGLDVDLWFEPPNGKETVSMVDAKSGRPSPKFTDRMARLVELAASDARVDRLFVNPILKRALCERGGAARDWLRKVRPWWGHDDHFHVRLACPADSPECSPQSALPPGDGCDGLAWWFDPKAQEARKKEHASYSQKVGATPPLPERCNTLASEKP
jgi:penicillin-insensitive murein endopeptidase